MDLSIDKRAQRQEGPSEAVSPADSAVVAAEVAEPGRAEETLRAGEERLRIALDGARIGMWSFDLTTGVVDCTPLTKDLFGLDPDAPTPPHEQWIALIHPDDRAQVLAIWSHSIAQGASFTAEFRVTRPDGSVRWIDSRGKTDRQAGGNQGRFIGIVMDSTEHKRREEEQRHERELLQTIIDRIPVMITLYEPDAKVLRLNPEFERTIGWSPTAAADVSLMEECYPDPAYREHVRSFMEACPEGWMDIHMRARDGRTVETSWANVRLTDRRQVGIGIDITERKRIEQSMSRRASEQAALYSFTDRLHRAGSVHEVYAAALDAMLDALKCDRASILLFDAADVMRFVAWRGLTDAYRQAVEGHSPWHAGEMDPQSIGICDIDLADLPDPLKVVIRAEGIRALAFIPLVAEGKLIGKFMIYYDAPHGFAAEDFDLALTVGRQLAFGIERKRAEEALRQHQSEIEALNQRLRRAMTETHHRVKNNLQLIAAMLEMHLLDGEAMLPISDVKRLIATVKTLATIHDLLTEQAKQDGSAQFVSAAAVLGKLIALLQHSLQDYQMISFVEDLPLSVRQGTSLAIVVNELVSNAAKHARTQIGIRLAPQEQEAVLSIWDDGPGFAEGFHPKSSAHTGLELVEHLSRWDLGGYTVYDDNPGGGARVRVTFPITASTSGPIPPETL